MHHKLIGYIIPSSVCLTLLSNIKDSADCPRLFMIEGETKNHIAWIRLKYKTFGLHFNPLLSY